MTVMKQGSYTAIPIEILKRVCEKAIVEKGSRDPWDLGSEMEKAAFPIATTNHDVQLAKRLIGQHVRTGSFLADWYGYNSRALSRDLISKTLDNLRWGIDNLYDNPIAE